MRLIDADELLDEIKSMRITLGGKDIFPKEARDSIAALIEDEPTAYDIVKVVKELEKIGTSYCTKINCNNECCDCDHGCLMGAIVGTVTRGGE